MKLNATEELLPLDAAERVVSVRRRRDGHVFRHVFRRITAADWRVYFGNVRTEFADAGRGPRQIIGVDAASLRLYSEAILRVDGFDMPDGRKPEEQPNWPRCIPRGSRLVAVALLKDVSVTEKAVVTEAGATSVRVDALWNEGEPGAMKQYRGLVHHFASQTAEHRQRFSDACRAGVMMTGTRQGKFVIPSGNAVLVALYDALIVRTEGYAISGRELANNEEAVREMDNIHKGVSVTGIFPASLESGELNAFDSQYHN